MIGKSLLTFAALVLLGGVASAQNPIYPSYGGGYGGQIYPPFGGGYGGQFGGQFGGSPYKSPVSPYYLLRQPGISPAGAYYNLIRPQLQFQNQLLAVQAQANINSQAVAGAEQQLTAGAPMLPITGQPVGFQTQKMYFMNLAGAGGTNISPYGGVPGSNVGSNVGNLPAPKGGGKKY